MTGAEPKKEYMTGEITAGILHLDKLLISYRNQREVCSAEDIVRLYVLLKFFLFTFCLLQAIDSCLDIVR